ncbi:MAG: HD domain-containing protein [Lachnospiraceae bacterium]|nr:HD domain-containing protein [Lachnospiraceae bacterium]
MKDRKQGFGESFPALIRRISVGTVLLVMLTGQLVFAAQTGPSAITTPEKAAQAPAGNGNASHISVDVINHTEGYSAVLYDNTNGLPTSEANAIAETSDGFIWIGSYAGLIRYDGNTFERMYSTDGISSIKCLFVDSKDRLWIGTNDNGVALLERGELKKWGKLDGMSSAHTRAITEDKNGIIYVATTSGIMTIDPEFNLRHMDDPEIAEANMRGLVAGDDGILYGFTDGGDVLTIKDGKLNVFIPSDKNVIVGGIGSILPDPASPGKIYFEGADFGFYRATLGDNLTELEPVNIQPLTCVYQLNYIDGKIWICASNGIGVLDGGVFHLLENLPMENNVGGMMVDYLGNLWFTSSRQGVMKIVPNQFADLFERFDLPQTVVNTTCMSEGKLFVGTDTGLMVLDENGPVSSFPLKKAISNTGKDLGSDDLIALLRDCRIRSIIRDSKDRIWISTWRKLGLLRYSNGEVMAFAHEDSLPSISLRAVAERDDGSILVASSGGADVIKDDDFIATYGEKEGITNPESLCIEEGFNGDILLGSNGNGIYVIGSDSGVRNINVEDGLPSDIVMRLRRDEKRNVVWIVTSSAIAYMTPDYKITTVKEFPYTNNFDLYENKNGDMWVLGSSGIYVTPAEELIRAEEINAVYYSLANGLSCITTANSYSELTSDGDLYIAGTTGVCKVNIDQPLENVNDLKATVPYVIADDETIYPDETGSFTVPAGIRRLTVPSFVFNFSLSDPKVSYQLEGFEQHETTVNRSEMVPMDYTNLGGGIYHYIMRIKDAMGREDKEISIKITKEKAFYEELWFYLVVGVLAVVALVFGVRQYVRKKTRAIEKKNQETMTLIHEITEAFAKVIDMKDRYTNGHSSRVAKYTTMLARELGYDEDTVERYYRIALLHDIGKIGIPQEVLNKPGKLTDEEFETIKSHTTLGYETLKDISIMPELSIGAQSHHERPDGKGYPNHLKGDEIPRAAQIIAVADCFDAMYSNRPYRNRMNFEKVCSIIKEVSGTQLTPDVVDAFLRLVDKGEFRAPDDFGGGTMETVDNIKK